jgi:uncharacterized integral membrane protein
MMDDERGRPVGPEGGPDDRDTLRTAGAAARRDDEQHLHDLQRARQARVAKVVAALVILVILIVFIIANANPVRVSFVFVTRHPKLIWVMLACAILGGILGYLIGKPGRQVRLHRPDDERSRQRSPREDADS